MLFDFYITLVLLIFWGVGTFVNIRFRKMGLARYKIFIFVFNIIFFIMIPVSLVEHLNKWADDSNCQSLCRKLF